jgi:uncharacterized protein (TIGR00299 family) protein
VVSTSSTTVAWIDASSGASGDMLLGALVAAGAPLEAIQSAIDLVSPEPVTLRIEEVQRNGFAATRVHVEVADSSTHRTWADIRTLLAPLDGPVRSRAVHAFTLLAEAEGRVHGTPADDVHFHEVGALDSIADVVGVSAGLAALGIDVLVVSPIAVGGGQVRVAHGSIGVPAPAVVELLRGVPTYGGPVELELCTPTGAALLVANATGFGPQPAMATEAVGVGAGGRDPEGHANVVRLLVGEMVSTSSTTGDGATAGGTALVIETNVDDLDPRLWPDVIAALLNAGASDAWLTPILMKKGRPAHTLHVLTGAERADAVRREIFRQTSTIGLRETTVAKHALDREMRQVEIGGHRIAVKLARLDGELMNVQPEYDDIAAAARALNRPIKEVLSEAIALTRTFA